MNRVLGDKKAIFIFVMPALLLFIFIVIIPLVLSVYFSLFEWDGIGEKTFTGIKNYCDLFLYNNDGFIKSVINTFVLTFLTIAIQLPAALVIALILASGIKGEKLFRTIYFIPVMLSSVVIGYLWKRIYHPNFGLLNNLLEATGLSFLSNTWLGDRNTALIAVCIPIIWQWIGYHMLLMYGSARGIPVELKEAARIDGASPVKIAWKIVIPLMAPVLKVCLILAVVGSLKAFDLIFILTNGGPAHASEVPSTLMVNTIFHKYMYGYGSAMAVFIVVECLVLTLVIQKLFKVEDIKY